VAKRTNYRKLAFNNYPPICTYCGFGIPEILEVAHLDGDRNNNDIENLAILCPNCHKMHDVDLISTEMLQEIRDRERAIDWSKRMKDAGKKAAATRKLRKEIRSLAGQKAVITRKRREAGRKAAETRKKNHKQ
jgi:5-methylcytosine-specific restriction endonuclease McrA